MNHDSTNIGYTVAAVIGTAAPAVGLLTSLQSEIEWGLRVASLSVGFIVGSVSIYSMIRHARKKKGLLAKLDESDDES